MDGQGTRWRRKIAENFNRLSRVHQRYRQTDDGQTDGRAIAYSERECEFTFAKNHKVSLLTTSFHDCFQRESRSACLVFLKSSSTYSGSESLGLVELVFFEPGVFPATQPSASKH